MFDNYYTNCILALFILTLLHFVTDKIFLKIFKIKNNLVSFESANLALDRIETWTKWITGLQTAAIAAMGFLINEKNKEKISVNDGFFALLFFGASIILSTWLLGCLPSIQQRLKKEQSTKNDIYMLRIFEFLPFRMGRFGGLIHTYFLVGIIFFARFIFKSFQA